MSAIYWFITFTTYKRLIRSKIWIRKTYKAETHTKTMELRQEVEMKFEKHKDMLLDYYEEAPPIDDWMWKMIDLHKSNIISEFERCIFEFPNYNSTYYIADTCSMIVRKKTPIKFIMTNALCCSSACFMITPMNIYVVVLRVLFAVLERKQY